MDQFNGMNAQTVETLQQMCQRSVQGTTRKRGFTERSLTMSDDFLERTGVTDEGSAIQNAMESALQHNKVYKDGVGHRERRSFRDELYSQLRKHAQKYSQPVSDQDHFAAIREICDYLSRRFEAILEGGRFRYGTAQKAFNLYLKFLWRLERIPAPPHCPCDRLILDTGGIPANWTESDSETNYRDWIKILRRKADLLSLGLAEWEYDLWSSKNPANGNGKSCR